MKHINLPIDIEVYTMEELSQVEQQLLKAAIDATQNAYAKYSHFRVGAALLLNDGRTVIGANQENAAYPSGLCAERSAIFAAQSQFPDQPILWPWPLEIRRDICWQTPSVPAVHAGRWYWK